MRRLDDKMAVFHDVSHQCSFQFHGRDVREDMMVEVEVKVRQTNVKACPNDLPMTNPSPRSLPSAARLQVGAVLGHFDM